MRTFLSLLTAMAVSLAAYFVLFGFIVSRPLVVDQISIFMDKKLAYAQATPHPKIFIVAGSNARFSHSCAVLEAALKRPCVNMGISGDVALDWTLEKNRAQLAAGDLVYLPIEYEFYQRSKMELETSMDAAYRFRHDKASLLVREPEGMVRAAFMFGLPTLVQSIGEMGLKAMGVQRRFNIDAMNRQGDEIGHDGAKRIPYLDVVRRTGQEIVPKKLLTDPQGAEAAIADFLEWCRSHGVTAVGGLPTIFNDTPLSGITIAELEAFYARHGAKFILLANRSQYPRADFYDSGYHLRQSAQLRHSEILAQALRPLLPRSP